MIRHPAVAGQFYPAQAQQLAGNIHGYIDAAHAVEGPGICKGLLVPHAGYMYSGPVAGEGYALLSHLDQTVSYNVVILAPSHHVSFRGAALPEADVFRTPLGDVSVGNAAMLLAGSTSVFVSGQAHALEHAIEVQLPFLQVVLRNFSIIPLVLGDVDCTRLAREIVALNLLHPLIIASSDLSHYDPYDVAVEHDRATIDLIVKGEGDRLTGDDACGFMAIRTLLSVAHLAGWSSRLLSYENSGDTAGDKSAVVGYTAVSFEEA
jgi:AmmeMemoRadiSam system protein B